MSSDGGAARLIAHVAQSPKLCAAHDRAGWVNLFAADGQVNDPIGSQPHDGHAAIERFYDTFIAPNALSFAVEHDIVCGMTVMRDLNIDTTMATGAKLSVPMHLRYELVDEGGALKIRRLYAHWELPQMMLQMSKQGLLGVWTSLALTPRLLRHQGVAGVVGFMRGYGGHGRAGKKTAEAFLTAASRGDLDAARAGVAEGCTFEAPPGTTASLPDLIAGLRGMTWRKWIGAADYVSATVFIGSRRGVALFHFGEGPARISSLQLYV
jgi:hypothetical protein